MQRYPAALLALVPALLLAPSTSSAQKKPTIPTKPGTKGQGQMVGGDGQFGTVYSLKNGFNFAILSARYTVEAFSAYSPVTPTTDQKLLVLDFAIKNAKPADNFLDDGGLFTLVDSKGQLYTSFSVALKSLGSKPYNGTLRPGQGLGQGELKDPFQAAFAVPGNARIVKIMVNQGRLNTADTVLRYYVAGATREEAGAAGDPKNVVAGLPENVRDPSGKDGAIALDEGKGTQGVDLPSGTFRLRIEGLAYSTDADLGELPEGKRFAVLTVVAKQVTDKDNSFFELSGGDTPIYQVTTADGDRIQPTAFRKASSNEDADHEFKPGDEYRFRVLFTVPADGAIKKLVVGAGQSRKWAMDPATIK